MKIYTKTGDTGQTSLVGGTRVSKADLRLDAYGTADELNSFIGLLRAKIEYKRLDELLESIQNKLFNLGAYLATSPEGKQVQQETLLHEADVEALERAIDTLEADLPPLRGFILPAGTECVALAHVCRSVTRRLERHMVALTDTPRAEDLICLQYVNRLSDFLFVLARKIAHTDGCADVFWKK